MEHAREKISTKFEALGRCNMVLGIQWVAKLGIILWDFNNLRIELIVDGRKFVLRDAIASLTKLVSIDQI